jgi:hypothetical protein
VKVKKEHAASELLEQMEDRPWLAKVTNSLNQYWQRRNAAKKNGLASGHVTASGCGRSGRDNLSTGNH